MAWQLIIYREPDVLDLAVSAVSSSRGLSSEIRTAGNLADARKLMAELGCGSCDLVVLGSSTPESDSSEGSDPGRQPTRNFLRELKESNSQVQVIVLSTVPDDVLVGFLEAYRNTALLMFDSDWRDSLIRKAAAVQPAEPDNPDFLELRIEIRNSKEGHWWLQRRGKMDYRDHGMLPLEERLFDRIVRRSRSLDGDIQGRNWRNTMIDIAEDLEEMLFDNNNRMFWKKFTRHCQKTGGLERTWVRFSVNPETEIAFLEALKELDDAEHWMLTAPIFRKYPPLTHRLPLFKDAASRQANINCLIIEADAQGGMVEQDGKQQILVDLPNVEQEVRDVSEVLRRARADGKGVGEVEVLRVCDERREGRDPLQEVLRAMRRGCWHVIHFAGHAVQSGRGKSAALVLSADSNSLLHVENLCKYVGHAQFIFLSCCRSAESSLIMRLAEEAVPAILGFRWRVHDGGAANFARTFYSELFNRGNSHYKYLEYAFRDARKKLYDRDESDPTWASPMLVLQMDQAQGS